MRLPLFCPNPQCAHHHDKPGDYDKLWSYAGTYDTLVVGTVHRFKCLVCGKGFSERTFSIHYYTKKTIDLPELHRALTQGESLCSRLPLCEDLVADGFESFDGSQYFPNNINILVGKYSQFLYGFTHTTIRRKGRMSDEQKERRAALELRWKPPRGALVKDFATLLSYIAAHWDLSTRSSLELWTDEHKAYPFAIDKVALLFHLLAQGLFRHSTVSSKLPRTILNPLFSVNYYDRELRKDIAAYRRESTCFGRNVTNGVMRFLLHLVYHNYQKLYRIKRNDVDFVHAEVAGIPRKAISQAFEGFYLDRPFLSKVELTPYEKRLWLKKLTTPLKEKTEYVPKYARVA